VSGGRTRGRHCRLFLAVAASRYNVNTEPQTDYRGRVALQSEPSLIRVSPCSARAGFRGAPVRSFDVWILSAARATDSSGAVFTSISCLRRRRAAQRARGCSAGNVNWVSSAALAPGRLRTSGQTSYVRRLRGWYPACWQQQLQLQQRLLFARVRTSFVWWTAYSVLRFISQCCVQSVRLATVETALPQTHTGRWFLHF